MESYFYMMEVKFHCLIKDDDKVIDNVSTNPMVIFRGTNVDDSFLREIERLTCEKFKAGGSKGG